MDGQAGQGPVFQYGDQMAIGEIVGDQIARNIGQACTGQRRGAQGLAIVDLDIAIHLHGKGRAIQLLEWPAVARRQVEVEHGRQVPQAVGMVRRAMAAQKGRRRTAGKAIGADAPGDHRRAAQLADAHGQVEPFGHKVNAAVAQAHLDDDIGVALDKARDDGRQSLDADRCRRADADAPGEPAGVGMGQLVKRLGGLDDGRGAQQKVIARHRQALVAGRAFDQPRAIALLQRLDATADHGRRDAEKARCGNKAAQPHHSQERAQVFKLNHSILLCNCIAHIHAIFFLIERAQLAAITDMDCMET